MTIASKSENYILKFLKQKTDTISDIGFNNFQLNYYKAFNRASAISFEGSIANAF